MTKSAILVSIILAAFLPGTAFVRADRRHRMDPGRGLGSFRGNHSRSNRDRHQCRHPGPNHAAHHRNRPRPLLEHVYEFMQIQSV